MTDAATLIEDLTRPWRHGEHFDGRDIVVDEPLILDGLQVRGFDFSRACFKGGFSARGTVFRGLAWMRGATVLGRCEFEGAHFRTDFRADGLRADAVVLDACHLEGVLSFADAHLGSLSVQRGLVLANLTLQNAVIERDLNLSQTEIMGGLWTEGARFDALVGEGAEISGRIRLSAQAQKGWPG